MPNVVMLNLVRTGVAFFIVLVSVIMPNVVMLHVFVLNVVAPIIMIIAL
jgi:hypothetical protein